MDVETREALALWREQRLGLFIHWGPYAKLGGLWKGKETPVIGEKIMSTLRIPRREYERLAEGFNPAGFDAEQWVLMARQAGFRYLVITAKHHDGFAMFRSAADSYNIVKATPFGRDPMAELAEACGRHGLGLGFYYSHCLDWHAHGGAGNFWDADTGNGDLRAFAAYLERKVKPQLRELLTQYGPVCLIWFDTSAMITRAQALELKNFVKSLQPGCLVSGRIYETDPALGDYASLGDNEVPVRKTNNVCEGIVTTNDTWGFKFNDHAWKTPVELITILSRMAANDANLMINVGPTGEGLIPEPAGNALLEVGRWLDVNGDAIYGARGNPLPAADARPWYAITAKQDRLFVHFFKWPPHGFILHGLRNKVSSVRLLADRKRTFAFKQKHDAAMDYHDLRIELPPQQIARPVPVIEIAVDSVLDVNSRAYG